MAWLVKIIESSESPEQMTIDINAAIAALSPPPVASSDVIVTLSGDMHRVRIVLSYRST
jgi:hypothetical protein